MSTPPAATSAAAGPPPTVRLARQLQRGRRLEEAELVLRRAAPQDTAASRELAVQLHAQHRFGEAAELWRAEVARAPQDIAAVQGLVRALGKLHRFAEAAQSLAAAQVHAPASSGLLLEAARLAALREHYPEAMTGLHRVLARSSAPAGILDELAEIHVACHRFDAAEAVLDQLVAAEPGNTRWLVSLARAARERGDVETAMVRWHAVLELEPFHLRARVELGRLLEDAARLKEAEAVFHDLIEIHPDSAEPFHQLGRMAMFQSDLPAAHAWLERARALRPEDPWTAGLMIRTLAAQNRFRLARALADNLVERLPDLVDAHLVRAWTEERAGRIDRSVRWLRRTIERFPEAIQPALRLSDLLARNDRPDAARDVLEHALAIHPDCLSLNLARADLAFATGDLVTAGALVLRLGADYPEHRDVAKRMARIAVAEGRYAPARRLWREVTRYDRRVSGPPLHLERLDERPIPPPEGEIRLFTRVRNEGLRLPWLLDHYRRQGVDRFFVVDNGSDDGSRDYLLSRPDTHLFLTTDSYAVFGGGIRWLNHLLNRHGSGAWCLTVDVDEVLAYPHAERLDLRALTGHLERQGAEALFTFMLDLYAGNPLTDAVYAAGDDPFLTCRYFDRAGYLRRDCPDFPFQLVVGGLISRFLYDYKQDGVFLHKVPLVRWREGLHYTSSTHALFPIPLAVETGVLLHFKFLSDFIERARVEAARKQYWQGAKRYTEFSRRFEGGPAVDFRCALTERYESTAQLVDLGLMTSSPALDALAAAAAPAQPASPCG